MVVGHKAMVIENDLVDRIVIVGTPRARSAYAKILDAVWKSAELSQRDRCDGNPIRIHLMPNDGKSLAAQMMAIDAWRELHGQGEKKEKDGGEDEDENKDGDAAAAAEKAAAELEEGVKKRSNSAKGKSLRRNGIFLAQII